MSSIQRELNLSPLRKSRTPCRAHQKDPRQEGRVNAQAVPSSWGQGKIKPCRALILRTPGLPYIQVKHTPTAWKSSAIKTGGIFSGSEKHTDWHECGTSGICYLVNSIQTLLPRHNSSWNHLRVFWFFKRFSPITRTQRAKLLKHVFIMAVSRATYLEAGSFLANFKTHYIGNHMLCQWKQAAGFSHNVEILMFYPELINMLFTGNIFPLSLDFIFLLLWQIKETFNEFRKSILRQVKLPSF